jgi:hypothetical protein
MPEAGKPLIYVFEEEKTDVGFKIGAVTTRVGLDGAWAGANHGQSYFYFPVDPGDHRLCTAWQSSLQRLSKLGAATSFTAEAGKVYYFRVEVEERKDRQPNLQLAPVDVAEGQLMVASSALSNSHAKKPAAPPDDSQP